MVNTKAVVLLLALSMVVAIAGISFAQYASAQANATQGVVVGQLPQSGYNGYYQAPQQGYYPYGGAQYGNYYGYGHSMGMGMCGRFW